MSAQFTTTIDANTVARCIIKHRHLLSKTQAQLAEELSVSFQAVSKWERGMCLPDLQKLILMADMFEIPLDEFFNRNVNPNNHSDYSNENTAFNTAKHLLEARCNFNEICDLLKHLGNAELLSLGYIALQKHYKLAELSPLCDSLSPQGITDIIISSIENGYSVDEFKPLLNKISKHQICDVINTLTQYNHSFSGMEDVIIELEESHINEIIRTALDNSCKLDEIGKLIDKITSRKEI